MRNILGVIAAVLLGIVLFISVFAWWFDGRVVDSEVFVDTTLNALREEAPREAMAELIVNRLVEEYPLVVLLKANLIDMFADLLDTPALGTVLRFVGTDIHERVITGNQEAIAISLLEYKETILSPIEAVSPALAGLIPDRWFVSIEILEEGALPDLSAYATSVARGKFFTAVGAALLVLFVLGVVARKGAAVLLVGLAFLLSAIASLLVVPGGRFLALRAVGEVPTETIARAIYDDFVIGLIIGAIVFLVMGIALVAVGLVMWLAMDQGPGRNRRIAPAP